MATTVRAKFRNKTIVMCVCEVDLFDLQLDDLLLIRGSTYIRTGRGLFFSSVLSTVITFFSGVCVYELESCLNDKWWRRRDNDAGCGQMCVCAAMCTLLLFVQSTRSRFKLFTWLQLSPKITDNSYSTHALAHTHTRPKAYKSKGTRRGIFCCCCSISSFG